MALPETDLTIDAIQDVLGYYPNDVGLLCQSDKINPYSTDKPVYAESTTEEWWKARDGDAAVTIPVYNGEVTQRWGHKHPTGGENSPYDMGHFRDYNHAATIPFNLETKPERILLNDSIVVYHRAFSSDLGLCMADINPNLKLGVEIFDFNGTSLGWVSEREQDIGISLLLPSTWDGKLATWKFFLTDVYNSLPANNPSHTRYAMPRQVDTDNPNWYDVPIAANAADNAYVHKFEVSWSPFNNQLIITVNTKGYLGDAVINIRPRTSEPGTGFNYAVELIEMSQDDVFVYSNVYLTGGIFYTCTLQFYSRVPGQEPSLYSVMEYEMLTLNN